MVATTMGGSSEANRSSVETPTWFNRRFPVDIVPGLELCGVCGLAEGDYGKDEIFEMKCSVERECGLERGWRRVIIYISGSVWEAPLFNKTGIQTYQRLWWVTTLIPVYVLCYWILCHN